MRHIYHGLRFVVLAICLAFSCTRLAVAASPDPQKLDFAPLPQWVKSFEATRPSQLDQNLEVHYLLYDRQVNLTGEHLEDFVRLQTKVAKQQGLATAAKIEISFAPAYQQVLMHDIAIIRDGKKLSRLDTQNIKLFQREDELDSGLYQEMWQALMILDDVRIGDVVQYSYSIVGSNPVLGKKHFGESYLNASVPLGQVYFRVLSNEDEYLGFQLNNSELKVSQRVENGLKELVVVDSNVAPVSLEKRMPRWVRPFASIEFSQYRSWQEVNQWAMSLYPKSSQLPDALKQLLDTQSFEDKSQAITFATQWIQDNVRYFGIEVGVNSHRPSLPLETFERRYGDCKDKTVLLNAALNYLGVKASPALVSVANNRNLAQRLPSPGVFDHVITEFDYQGQKHWVDATMSGQNGPVDSNSFPNLHWGLIVNDKTDGLTAMTAVSEQQLKGKLYVEETVTVDNKKLDASKMHVKVVYDGWKADSMRGYYEKQGLNSISDQHVGYYAYYFDKVKSANTLSIDNNPQGLLQLDGDYIVTMEQQAVPGRHELKFYGSTVIDEVRPDGRAQRQFPYALSGQLDVHQRIIVKPERISDVIWRGEVEPFEVKNQWFEFRFNASKQDDAVVLDYFYSSISDHVAAKDYSTYLAQIDSIDAALAYSLWIRQALDERDAQRKKSMKNLLDSLIKKKW